MGSPGTVRSVLHVGIDGWRFVLLYRVPSDALFSPHASDESLRALPSCIELQSLQLAAIEAKQACVCNKCMLAAWRV
jgi:hypothetical protein